MKKFLAIFFTATVGAGCFAAVPYSAKPTDPRAEIAADPAKAGGVYFAYPQPQAAPTPAPGGYVPFYISHYGRHGSRYLINEKDYTVMTDLLKEAATDGQLTPLGEEVLARLESFMPQIVGRNGDLSATGVRQQRGIASRMLRDYPEVFADSARIMARSTPVLRCALTMDALCERLKESVPSLAIDRDASDRYLPYLNYHSPEWHKAVGDSVFRTPQQAFRDSLMQGDRMVASLFRSPEYAAEKMEPAKIMEAFYWIAADMQDIGEPASFFDLFTAEELFNMWQIFNSGNYVYDSAYPLLGGEAVANAAPLTREIIARADSAIAGVGHAADLRFGHDGNVIPFTAMLGLAGCDGAETDMTRVCDAFANYRVTPMAANIQLVFYRNEADPDDVLVKVLLNERETAVDMDTDIWPYYRWSDFRPYLESRIRRFAAK